MSPPREQSAPSADARLTRIIQAFLGVMVSLQFLYFLAYSWRMAAFPGQLDYGEGPILQIALRVARGQTMYPPLDQGYPYVIASYLPGYYLLSALAVKLTGASFLGGRVVSCLAALTIAACVGLIVHRRTGSRYAALASGGTVLAIPVYLVWATLMRIDMAALAFAVAGFYLFTREKRLPAVVLFSLGLFTRRTAVGPIVAAFSGLVLQRKWRTAFGWAAALAGLTAALLIAAQLITRGGMYEQLRWHTSTSLGKSWSWGQLLDLLHKGWLNWPVYYVVSAVGAVWCLVRRPHRDLGIWSLVAWAIYLTSGRIGSTYNYFLEPFAVGMTCVGVLIGEALGAAVKAPERAAPALRVLALGVMGALALQMVRTDTKMNWTLQVIRPYASGEATALAVEALRAAPEMVMCEDVGLIELAGKEIPFDPFEFTMLARAGAINGEPVLEDVREGRYSLFITRFDVKQMTAVIGDPRFGFVFDRFPAEMVRALAERYQLIAERRPYYLYVPKPPDD